MEIHRLPLTKTLNLTKTGKYGIRFKVISFQSLWGNGGIMAIVHLAQLEVSMLM